MHPFSSQNPHFQSQLRATTRSFDQYGEAISVILLVPRPSATLYKKDGSVAKRQNPPHQIGDVVYAKLSYDGKINLYPFSLAGAGYEIIMDADENIHYEFI